MTPSSTILEKMDAALPISNVKKPTSLIMISMIAFLSYSRSLKADFVFDDHEAIVNNKDVTSPNSSLNSIFSNDFWGASITHQASHKSYRPITILIFKLIYQLCGKNLDPFNFHLVNLILHSVISCLVNLIYNLFFEMHCPKAAFLGAVFFAVHPIHTETVVGVVGQAELLGALFSLLSFIIYHYGCIKKESIICNFIYSIISFIFCSIAMLCKEQGITMMAVIILYDTILVNKLTVKKLVNISALFSSSLLGKIKTLLPCCESQNKNTTLKFDGFSNKSHNSKTNNGVAENLILKQNTLFLMFVRQLILVCGTLLAIYFRWVLMGSSLPIFQKTDNPTSFENNFFIRVLNFNYIYLINLWILICPQWLCFDWSMGCIPLIQLDSEFDYRIIFVCIFWSLLSYCVYNMIKSSEVCQRSLFMGLSSMFILFLPASNIIFNVGFVIAERVLYLPSIGYFLVLIIGIQKIASFEKYQRIIRFLVAFTTVVFIVRSVQRTEDWMTENKLFSSALDVCPLNAKVHYNLAKNSADNGFRKMAIEHYEEAIRLHPYYDQAMNNLANIYRDEGYLGKAEKLLLKAVQIRSDFATGWMNLGIVYSSMGSWNRSESCYLEALKHRKKYPDCYYNLGNLYLELRRNSDALDAWKNAILLKPTHRIAWSNRILMLDSMGRLDEALDESYMALTHLRNEPNIHFNIANILGKLNRYVESEKHFLQAIRLKPSLASYHYNLGVLYHRWNKYCKAQFYYKKANLLDTNSKAKKQLISLENSGKLGTCQ